MEDEENKIPYIKDSITPKEEKGLTMVVKGLSKKYPFITGWEPIKNYKDWEGCIFMNLKVDPYKLGEYFNCPLSKWWDITFRNNPQDYDGYKFYSLRAYFPNTCLDSDTAQGVRRKMEESLQSMYEHIPEQYAKIYAHTSESIRGNIYREIPFISEFTLDLSDITSVDNLS